MPMTDTLENMKVIEYNHTMNLMNLTYSISSLGLDVQTWGKKNAEFLPKHKGSRAQFTNCSKFVVNKEWICLIIASEFGAPFLHAKKTLRLPERGATTTFSYLGGRTKRMPWSTKVHEVVSNLIARYQKG